METTLAWMVGPWEIIIVVAVMVLLFGGLQWYLVVWAVTSSRCWDRLSSDG